MTDRQVSILTDCHHRITEYYALHGENPHGLVLSLNAYFQLCREMNVGSIETIEGVPITVVTNNRLDQKDSSHGEKAARARRAYRQRQKRRRS